MPGGPRSRRGPASKRSVAADSVSVSVQAVRVAASHLYLPEGVLRTVTRAACAVVVGRRREAWGVARRAVLLGGRHAGRGQPAPVSASQGNDQRQRCEHASEPHLLAARYRSGGGAGHVWTHCGSLAGTVRAAFVVRGSVVSLDIAAKPITVGVEPVVVGPGDPDRLVLGGDVPAVDVRIG